MNTACTSVWIWEAIWIWLQGAKLDGYCIFGMSTVWIGRIAKVASFLSAMTIIIDIMGEEKIHSITSSIHRNVTESNKSRFSFVERIEGDVDYYMNKSKKSQSSLIVAILIGCASFFDTNFKKNYAILMVVLSAITPLFILVEHFNWSGDWRFWLTVAPIIFFCFQMALLTIISVHVFLFACFAALLAGIEYVLSDQSLCRRLRIWAASIFVTSFMVDLLMS